MPSLQVSNLFSSYSYLPLSRIHPVLLNLSFCLSLSELASLLGAPTSFSPHQRWRTWQPPPLDWELVEGPGCVRQLCISRATYLAWQVQATSQINATLSFFLPTIPTLSSNEVLGHQSTTNSLNFTSVYRDPSHSFQWPHCIPLNRWTIIYSVMPPQTDISVVCNFLLQTVLQKIFPISLCTLVIICVE